MLDDKNESSTLKLLLTILTMVTCINDSTIHIVIENRKYADII